MKNRLHSIALVLLISLQPYSCHKPTKHELYADSRRCFAALDTNLHTVTPDQFRSAGIDADAVDLASRDAMSAAFDIGEAMGMAPAAINRDLHQASIGYRAAHTWLPQGSDPKFTALGSDVNDCLEDYYGRPND